MIIKILFECLGGIESNEGMEFWGLILAIDTGITRSSCRLG